MTAVPVTGVVSMGLGRKDSRPWKAWSPVYRQGSAGEVITTRGKEFPVQVVAGVFSAMLEPGVVVIENPDGKQYTVTVPAEGGNLWAIIAAAAALPPDVPESALGAAVATWLSDNPDEILAELSQNGAVTGAAAAAAPDAVNTYIAENLGDSHIFIDTDGAPYFDAALTGGQTVLADTDGTPYVPAIGA